MTWCMLLLEAHYCHQRVHVVLLLRILLMLMLLFVFALPLKLMSWELTLMLLFHSACCSTTVERLPLKVSNARKLSKPSLCVCSLSTTSFFFSRLDLSYIYWQCKEFLHYQYYVWVLHAWFAYFVSKCVWSYFTIWFEGRLLLSFFSLCCIPFLLVWYFLTRLIKKWTFMNWGSCPLVFSSTR